MRNQSNNHVDVYQMVTDRILGQLDQGIIPWRKPWHLDGTNAPRNATTNRPYRGVNLWLLPSEYSDQRYVTYRQAQALGGNVRKGEHGHMVVFWKMLDREDEDDNEDTRRKVVPLLRYYTVFNVAQCDGLNLPAIETPVGAELEPDNTAEAIIANMPNRPEIILEPRDQAFYMPATDSITMSPRYCFETNAEFYATLFHELTHSTGHPSRLDRHAQDVPNRAHHKAERSREELTAEFGSAYLCAVAGVANESSETNSAAYIQSWRSAIAGDNRMVVVAAGAAQKAADYILSGAETETPSPETAQQGALAIA